MARALRPARRFTRADLMILVAATAAGVAMIRPYVAVYSRPNFVSPPSLRAIETTYGVWSPVAACLMLSLLVIQHRGPHPTRARLLRRPGHVACCVAAVALAWGATYECFRYACRDLSGRTFNFQEHWITVSVPVGPAIEGAWLILFLSGRWRADPGWIDRLERLLGCLWIGWNLFWLLPSPIRNKIPPFWDGLLT